MFVVSGPGGLENDHLARLPLQPKDTAAVRKAFTDALQPWWDSGPLPGLACGVLTIHLEDGWIELYGLVPGTEGMTARSAKKLLARCSRDAKVRSFAVVDRGADQLPSGNERRLANILSAKEFRKAADRLPQPGSKKFASGVAPRTRVYWATPGGVLDFQPLHFQLDAILDSDPGFLREGQDLAGELLKESHPQAERAVAQLVSRYAGMLGFHVIYTELLPAGCDVGDVTDLWFSPTEDVAMAVATRTHTPASSDDLAGLIASTEAIGKRSIIGAERHRLLVLVRPENAAEYEQIAAGVRGSEKLVIATPHAILRLTAVLHKLWMKVDDLALRMLLISRADLAIAALAEVIYPGHAGDAPFDLGRPSEFEQPLPRFLAAGAPKLPTDLPRMLLGDDPQWRQKLYEPKPEVRSRSEQLKV